MSTLAQIRDRVELYLMDTGNAIWSTDLIDEALRLALDEYSWVSPQSVETYITLAADGREVSLSSLSGLIDVVEVWYPYNHAASTETFPPNKVKGWRMWWDGAIPILYMDMEEGAQPQSGEEVRLWYAKRHTIDGLDSETATTVPAYHETKLVLGAAGHAALSRAADLIETANQDVYAIGLLATWGRSREKQWMGFLDDLRRRSARHGRPWSGGWGLDKWDEQAAWDER